MNKVDFQNGMYKNPILYGDYSDPDAIRVGKDYFMIASSFSNTPGLPLLHSADLVHWKVVKYLLPELPFPRYDKPVHGCGVWAPSIRYHNQKYYVCFPMPDEGIFMITADNPMGEWSKPVILHEGAGWIDPCPFWDDDGKAYLVFGVAKSRIGYKSILYISEMKPDGSGLIGKPVAVFDGNKENQDTIEGPKLYKRNHYYYIFAPAGGVKTGWQVVLRADSITGPYKCRIVMRQGSTQINGPHQGAWVDTEKGEDWFIHFQDVYSGGRIVHLQPMIWKDNWPVIGRPVEGEEYGEPVDIWKKPDVDIQNECNEKPDNTDYFEHGKYNLAWQWNANQKKGWYDEANEKGLRLRAISTGKDVPIGDYPNLLLQKWPAAEFHCITKLNLQDMQIGDYAGFISLGMEYGAVQVFRMETGYQISYVTGKQYFGDIVVDHTDEEEKIILSEYRKNDIWIRYEVKRCGWQDISEEEKHFPKELVTFSISDDGQNYENAGTMTAVPGRWVGVKTGVYCGTHQLRDGGHISVEYVKYEL